VETEFQAERGSFSTVRETCDTIPSADPSGPGKSDGFLPELQQFLGTDTEPDTLFFVESWTLGIPKAVENARQRKMECADRDEQHNRMFHQFADLASRIYVEEVLRTMEQLRWSQASDSSPKPHKWVPAQPYGADLEESADWPEGWNDNQDTDLPMTPDLACRILGVSAKSTHGEIKTAYRRMVNRWHPDRLESHAEQERQTATRKMTAINQAHRLLCTDLRKPA
jgi:DnaJ-domain-containing protein 1